MKIFLTPPYGLSRAMTRVSQELSCRIPSGVTVVDREADADVVLLHTVGYPETVEAMERLRRKKQKAIIAQYCLRSTQKASTRDWVPLWWDSLFVWSYYDLAAAMEQDGVANLGRPLPTLYKSPLGVDAQVFTDDPAASAKFYTILTSGYLAEGESVLECSRAAERVHGRLFHLGPSNVVRGKHVVSSMGMDDATLSRIMRSCHFVSGLRRLEGFELPAAEGLLSGARPIMFDAPHYRAWFNGLAEFVPEGPPEEVTDAVERVFRRGPRPVTSEERREAVDRFDWGRIAAGFWAHI